jgi:hypothetical protein
METVTVLIPNSIVLDYCRVIAIFLIDGMTALSSRCKTCDYSKMRDPTVQSCHQSDTLVGSFELRTDS